MCCVAWYSLFGNKLWNPSNTKMKEKVTYPKDDGPCIAAQSERRILPPLHYRPVWSESHEPCEEEWQRSGAEPGVLEQSDSLRPQSKWYPIKTKWFLATKCNWKLF